MQELPIIYIRGYAGPTSGIDTQVDDPFYGFNAGATHVRIGGDGDPAFYQFEGPLLRLMIDENYQLLVRGDQAAYLQGQKAGSVPKRTLWIYRFYDSAATTFGPSHESLAGRVENLFRRHLTSDHFNLEEAARGLYQLIHDVLDRTGAAKVYLVAHSMGGLVARSMLQKVCAAKGNRSGPELVAGLFTYGTPHGGIVLESGVLNALESSVGPAGSDVFSPALMYGYLTPGATFGDEAPEDWDPQVVPGQAFPVDRIFCLVGTDPHDYGLSRVIVGPKSDGLVLIDRAYVRGAHRAYVYKSHSGRYGEVNSEEGYQNLRRFLFGRWGVTVCLSGLPRVTDQEQAIWQADVRLTIRGLPIVMSEQEAEHWCPVQLNQEAARKPDSADNPVPLISTFLIDPAHEDELADERHQPRPDHSQRMRYALTLRVFKAPGQVQSSSFASHLEQVPDWTDALIVDVGPSEAGLSAWAAWNSQVPGENSRFDPITAALPEPLRGPLALTGDGAARTATVPLPDAARALPILGAKAALTLRVIDREAT